MLDIKCYLKCYCYSSIVSITGTIVWINYYSQALFPIDCNP